MRPRHILSLAGLLCLAVPAQAQNCPPLTRAFSLDLTAGPGGMRYGVPVTINGKSHNFLLDTGNERSRLGRSVVTELKLSPRSQGRMLSRDGTVRNASVVTADLEIGPMKAPQHEMWVQEAAGPFDGIFAPDLMQNYDIELDFAGRKLNYFLTDHCPGRVVHWTTTGITSVAFTGWDNNSARRAMTIPVAINGREVMAEIDTSLTQTTLDADTASALFSLTADSEGAVPLGALDNNPAHRMYGYTFQTLKIGGLTIRNPRLRVVPDLIGSKSTEMLRSNSRVQRVTENFLPTMQIGMDVLNRLHLYVAAKEKTLYITGASGQAVTTPQAAAQAPAASQPAAAN